MSIATMKQEVENQLEDLPKFASLLRQLRPFHTPSSELVFTGSGDSYAAALFAQELSGGESFASDPYELSQKPNLSKGKNVVIISVSGKTKANIELARRLRRVAEKRIAVTANPDSQLAKQCDETITLDYHSAGKLTSGTISFTTSLLVCAYMLRKLPPRLNLEAPMKKANEWASSFRASLNRSFLFIGSGVNRALAEYGVCKVQEVLGAKADAQYPEQIGHAHLFSLNVEKEIIIGVSNDPSDKTSEVLRILEGHGFQTLSVRGGARDPVVQSLEIAFHLQHLALTVAKRSGLNECAFLSDKSRLLLSNKLIY